MLFRSKNFEDYVAETLFKEDVSSLGSSRFANAHAAFMRERSKWSMVQSAKAAVAKNLPKRTTTDPKPKEEEEKPAGKDPAKRKGQRRGLPKD